MNKYIAYCRKSTDKKNKQVLSIEQQVTELSEFAKKENLTVIDYLAEAKTAKAPGRKVFNQLIKLVEKGKANGILSWHPDRLARNTIDGGKIVYLLDTGKLQSLRFPSFWFENTPQGRFMLNIAFGQAKYYIDNLSENVKRGLRHKLRRGEWPTLAPLGYKNDKNTNTIAINPIAARLVKKAFKKFANGEFTMVDIRNMFFQHGIGKRSGKPLHLNTVRAMLTRPLYYSLIIYNNEAYEGNHRPLITKRLFDKAQVVFKNNYRTKPEKHNFPFTGLIRCKECGSAITAEKHIKHYPKTRGKVEYVYYRCVKKKIKCRQKYIRQKELEKQLRNIISEASIHKLGGNIMLAMLKKDKITEEKNTNNEAKRINICIESIEKKLDNLLEAYLDEIITTADYQKKKKELMETKMGLKNKITHIKHKGLMWLEPMEEFIKLALRARKIARKKRNSPDLLIGGQNCWLELLFTKPSAQIFF